MLRMRSFSLLALVASTAFGQALPGVEVFSGYSFSRLPEETGGLTPAGLNGWAAAVKLRMHPRFGWVFDFGGGYGERRIVPTEFQPRATLPGAVRHYTVMLGPEVRVFTAGRLTGNVRALIGALWETALTLPLEEPFVPPGSPPVTEFRVGPSKPVVGALGGNLDYHLTEHITLRLVQPELVVASLGSANLRRLRLSGGVVFTFGGR